MGLYFQIGHDHCIKYFPLHSNQSYFHHTGDNFCTVQYLLEVLTHLSLCGDGFMDFMHRPKSKVLKTLKIKINVLEAGSASVLR
jgi:hypothetical protein